MPRKKIPPPPLDETITLSSGVQIEIGSVEAHAHRSTTRGRAKVIEYGNKTDRILEHVVNDYFFMPDKGADGTSIGQYRPPRKNDYLRSGLAFARHLELQPEFASTDPNDETDHTDSWRRKYYPEVKRRIEAFRKALEDSYNEL
jgi:hypothetical protein